MKTILILFAGLFLVTGCRSHSDIRLSNGSKITGVSKPVLDQSAGVYRYKTATGRELYVPAGKVIAIEAR